MSTLKLYHTHTLGNIPMGYQVQETTQASLLNSIVDLIAQPFTSPPPQRVPQNSQSSYYQTTSFTQRPQTFYFTQTASTRKTIKPNSYTRPPYVTQPPPKPSTTSQLPPIVNNITSTSDRLSDFESQCGIPSPWKQEAVSLVVSGKAAHKGQVKN